MCHHLTFKVLPEYLLGASVVLFTTLSLRIHRIKTLLVLLPLLSYRGKHDGRRNLSTDLNPLQVQPVLVT